MQTHFHGFFAWFRLSKLSGPAGEIGIGTEGARAFGA